MIDVLKHNREAWNEQSRRNEAPWVQPVDAETIERARQGDWDVILTPIVKVPKSWFGELAGKRVLCLASGGGQQTPVLAAAGASVTSFDNSDTQLAKDAEVAARDDLDVTCEQGDMADLSRFAPGSFDLIFHPVSNVFAQDVRAVWRECHRVLVEGGRVLAGFMNPDFFLFDHESLDEGGPLEIKFKLPYSDLESLPETELLARKERGEAIEFSHSLDDQIGGQIEAGFVIAGLYEDRWDDDDWTRLNPYMPCYIATLAIKMSI